MSPGPVSVHDKRGRAVTGRVIPFDPAAHKVVDVLLPWFVNGTLEGDELEFVEQHVSRCARCQSEVEWLRGLHAACVAGEATRAGAPGLRQLRSRLEEPPPRRRGGRRWLDEVRQRLGPYSRWTLAMPVAAMVVVALWLLPAGDGPGLYRTLGAGNGKAVPSSSIVVVFDPTATEAELRRILREAGARIVDGPTQSNAYVIEVPAQATNHALQALRGEHAALLVEQLGPPAPR